MWPPGQFTCTVAAPKPNSIQGKAQKNCNKISPSYYCHFEYLQVPRSDVGSALQCNESLQNQASLRGLTERSFTDTHKRVACSTQNASCTCLSHHKSGV